MTDEQINEIIRHSPLQVQEHRWAYLREFARALLATHAGAAAEPVAWTLQWPSDSRINVGTVFDTEIEAKEYADKCDSVAVVPLYGAPLAALTSAPAEPWLTQMAEQANLIDRDRLEKWLIAYGISTGEGRERFSALVGQYVNNLTREEPFPAPPQTPQAAGAIDAREQEAPSDDEQLVATLIHCSREVSPTAMIGYDLASVLSRAAERIQSIATPPAATPAAPGECALFEAWLTREAGPNPSASRVQDCRMGWLAAIATLAAIPAPEARETEKLLRTLGDLVELLHHMGQPYWSGIVAKTITALKAAHPGERKEGK